jgi:hypothetical protein
MHNPQDSRIVKMVDTSHEAYVLGEVSGYNFVYNIKKLRSIGLWKWYINITITILDIIQRPVVYLKHKMDNFRTSQEAHYVSTTEPNGLMWSIGLWKWYINITITILDIIHRPVSYLKHMIDNVPTSQETYTSQLQNPTG